MRAYIHQINPINPIEQWPKTGKTPLGMPPQRAEPGRPKKLRRVEHDEVVPPGGTKLTRKYVVIKCSSCGEHGHNIKTCFRRQQENVVIFFFPNSVYMVMPITSYKTHFCFSFLNYVATTKKISDSNKATGSEPSFTGSTFSAGTIFSSCKCSTFSRRINESNRTTGTEPSFKSTCNSTVYCPQPTFASTTGNPTPDLRKIHYVVPYSDRVEFFIINFQRSPRFKMVNNQNRLQGIKSRVLFRKT